MLSLNIKSLSLILMALMSVSLVFTGCSQNGYSKRAQTASSKHAIVKRAKKMLGVKYRYGGSSPYSGFDCSGLVQYSHKAVGINLPRTASQQFKAATRISKKYLSPGDLVFFKTSVNRYVSHVGIYLGKNKFIHAPSSGKRVKISSMKNKYWSKRFTGAGRIL